MISGPLGSPRTRPAVSRRPSSSSGTGPAGASSPARAPAQQPASAALPPTHLRPGLGCGELPRTQRRRPDAHRVQPLGRAHRPGLHICGVPIVDRRGSATNAGFRFTLRLLRPDRCVAAQRRAGRRVPGVANYGRADRPVMEAHDHGACKAQSRLLGGSVRPAGGEGRLRKVRCPTIRAWAMTRNWPDGPATALARPPG
jgi:hypothetical protein